MDRALNYVLTHSNEFPKAEESRYNLGSIVGPGVLVAEGMCITYCEEVTDLFNGRRAAPTSGTMGDISIIFDQLTFTAHVT